MKFSIPIMMKSLEHIQKTILLLPRTVSYGDNDNHIDQ